MKKKLCGLMLCLAMSATLLAGCGQKSEGEKPAGTADDKKQSVSVKGVDGVFTYSIDGDTGNTLNPITADDRFGLMACHLLYSPAYYVNADGSVEYILAESMEPSDDGLTYTMKLKPDLKWSDGEPLTADDIVYTYDSLNKASENLYVDGQPIKVEKKDDTTVIFTLPSISASAFETLSAEVSIVPKHIFEGKDSFDINLLEDKVVGAGPYVLDEYVTGQHLKFSKNPNYALGEAKIDTIVFKVIEKADTATLALQNGEVDAWIGKADMLEPYENNDAFKISNYSEGRVAYLRLNPNTAAMSDKTYREGVLRALNRDEIMTAAYSDPEFYHLGYSFLPYTSKYYSEDVEKWDQDLDKAKEQTANGPKDLKLCYVEEDAIQTNIALTIQAELKAIGINVELNGINWAGYLKASNDKTDKENDIFLGGYVMGVDPDMYSPLFMSTKDDMIMYNNPKVDELFVKGNSTLDEKERMEIYKELQKEVSEEAIFYPFGTNLRTLVTNARVGGLDEAKLAPIYTFGDYSKLTLSE